MWIVYLVSTLSGVPDCVRAAAAAPCGRQLEVQVAGRHLVLRRQEEHLQEALLAHTPSGEGEVTLIGLDDIDI